MEKLRNKGLESLYQRENLENFKFEDFKELPPITQLFFYYYNVGSSDYIGNNIVKSDHLNIPENVRLSITYIDLNIWDYKGEILDEGYNYGIFDIIKYEDIVNRQNYEELKYDIGSSDYILMGYDDIDQWLLLGIKDFNKDELHMYGSLFDAFAKLADNIFEVFTMLQLHWNAGIIESIKDEIDDKYSEKDIFRQWGDIDWQLRGLGTDGQMQKNNTQLVKRGLGLLKQRENNPEKMDVLLEKLPFRTSIFYKYYSTGSYKQMFNFVPYSISLPDGSEGLVVEDRWWENEPDIDHRFGRLLTVEELVQEFEIYTKQEKEYHKKGFVLIGEMEDAENKLLLDITDKEAGAIWLYDNAGDYKKLSNDIFHLFTKVNRYWSDQDVVKATNGLKTGKDLYQNFGENFWRIKE